MTTTRIFSWLPIFADTARLRGYKKGWIWHQLQKQFSDFTLDELHYIAQQLGDIPSWQTYNLPNKMSGKHNSHTINHHLTGSNANDSSKESLIRLSKSNLPTTGDLPSQMQNHYRTGKDSNTRTPTWIWGWISPLRKDNSNQLIGSVRNQRIPIVAVAMPIS